MFDKDSTALDRAKADIRNRVASGDLVPEYADVHPELAQAVDGTFASDSTAVKSGTPADESFAFLRPPTVLGDLGQLGKYRIVRKLAQGGMGIVFEAFHTNSDRAVAVKVIRPPYADRPGDRARFLKEARAVAKLDHENVLTLHDVDEDGATLFQVMPLLRGETLAARLARGTLGAGEIVRLARGVASGLGAAHDAGLIHRDIKPSNIWLKPDAEGWKPLVFDFGLVLDPQTTSDNAIKGTPAYMSPEQAQSIDHPMAGGSDLFSLGIVLYEAATGKKVFERGNPLATIQATAGYDPPSLAAARPDLPLGVADLIHALLAKNPSDRPRSAAAVVAALNPTGGSREPASWTPPPSDFRAGERSPRDRRRWAIALGVLVFLAAGLGIGAASGLFRSEPADRPAHVNGIDPATPLTATVDMLFITGPNRKYSGWLRDAHTLPARPGDKVRVEVRISANAFCYVFAVSAGGKVVPLYPWTDRKWGSRPTEENPVRTVFAPPDTPGLKPKEFNVWTITAAERGMESVVAILRTERWELPDEKIEALFAGLEPYYELANEKAFVAFDNGAMVRTADRTRDYDGSDPQNAPNLQIQNIIARKLQPHAAFTTAVSFAKVEK